MASKLPPVKGAAYTFRCVLFAQSDNQIKSNPTLAAGDWKASIDGGAFANLATLPDVDPDGSVQVKVSLSADEMNGDEIMVTAIDAAGAEWHSAAWVIHTAAQTLDTMDANIDAALADTAELQADWADGGRLDVILDARASQTAVDDLPTNSELTTALADLPTNAELTAALADIEVDAGSVWSHATRTLTQTAAQIADAVSGDDLTIHRGDTFSATLTGLGDIAARDALYWTVKKAASQADSLATIQVEETAGLARLNGAEGTDGDGSLTVNDEDTGAVTLALEAAATSQLSPGTYVYDIQMVSAGDVTTLTAGGLTVVADVTRAIA